MLFPQRKLNLSAETDHFNFKWISASRKISSNMAKQVARKMDAKTCRKEERRDVMEEKAERRFRERELKKARKLLGEEFTQRRSARGQHHDHV